MKNHIHKAPCAPPGSQSPAPPRPAALSSTEATAQGTASAQCCSPWGQGGWETGLRGSLQRLRHNCPSCRQLPGALTEPGSKGRRRGEVRAQISFRCRWIQGCAVAGTLSSLWKPRKSMTKSPRSPAPGKILCALSGLTTGKDKALPGRHPRKSGLPHPSLVPSRTSRHRGAAGGALGLPPWQSVRRAGLRAQPTDVHLRPPRGGPSLRPS